MTGGPRAWSGRRPFAAVPERVHAIPAEPTGYANPAHALAARPGPDLAIQALHLIARAAASAAMVEPRFVG